MMNHIGLRKLYQEIENIPGKEYVAIEETARTPKILLDRVSENASIELRGRSLPDDARSFYNPILMWMQDYVANPSEITRVCFDLEYFNTASSKMLLQIVKLLQTIEALDKKLTVKWYYMEDDDDILESGKSFEELTNVQFDFISYQ